MRPHLQQNSILCFAIESVRQLIVTKQFYKSCSNYIAKPELIQPHPKAVTPNPLQCVSYRRGSVREADLRQFVHRDCKKLSIEMGYIILFLPKPSSFSLWLPSRFPRETYFTAIALFGEFNWSEKYISGWQLFCHFNQVAIANGSHYKVSEYHLCGILVSRSIAVIINMI